MWKRTVVTVGAIGLLALAAMALAFTAAAPAWAEGALEATTLEAQSIMDFTIYLTYDEPVAGQPAPSTVRWSTDPADAAATETLGVTWSYARFVNGSIVEEGELAPGSTFEAGCGYYPIFEDPTVNDGYFLYDQPVFINGVQAGLYDYNESIGFKLPTCVYGPLVANPTTKVIGYNLLVDEPEPGAVPDAFATVTFATANGNVAGTKEIATTWTEIDYPAFDSGMGNYTGRTMGTGDTFLIGKYYRVDAAPDDGVCQALPDGCYFNMFETETYTTSVNDIARVPGNAETYFFGPLEGEANYTLAYTYDDDNLSATVTGCDNPGGSLVIPATVTEGDKVYTVTTIANNAFYNKTEFTGTVTIPNTVKAIGNSAFNGCSNLTGKLTIPSCVESIGSNAFQQCGFSALEFEDGDSPLSIGVCAFYNCKKALGGLVIPARATSIGNQAFYYCEGLTSVEFAADSQLATIGNKAFYYCRNLAGNLTLPNNVTAIGEEAFYYCSNLQGTLTLSQNLQSVGRNAFSNCGFTGDLTIPGSLVTIPEYSFYWSGNFHDVTLAEGITDIGQRAFALANITGTLALPSSLTKIPSNAFSDCRYGGDLVIPDTVTEIGESAFEDFGSANNQVSSTGTLTLSSNLTTIGKKAFKGSKFTGALVIPNSVTSMGERAFCDSCYISELTLPENDAFTTIPKMAFGNSNESSSNYGFTNMGLTGTLVIPANVTEIGERAFQWNRSLEGIGFADGSQLSTIGDYAFYYCDAAESELALPATLTTIGNYAFAYCKKLSGDLLIPNSVTSLGEYAFFYCEGFDGAFRFPDNESMTSVPKCAFEYCSNLVGPLQLPSRVKTISFGAFEYCKNLKATITGEGSLLDGIESIGDYAFYYCLAFGPKLTVPSSVTYLGAKSFGQCMGITAVEMHQTDPVLREGVFTWCENLESIGEIPATVTEIQDDVFWNCYALTGDITIPEGVVTIGDTVFWDCRKLTGKISIPSTVTSISSGFLRVSYFTTIVNNSEQTLQASSALYDREGHFVDSTGKEVDTIGKGTYRYTEGSAPAPIDASSAKVTLSKTAFVYNGKAQKPTVKAVKLGTATVTSGNYSVSYLTSAKKATTAPKTVGTYYAKVTFKGAYSGSKLVSFKINPKGTSLVSVAAASRGFTAKWKKQATQTTGYQVQYSLSAKFKSAKTVTVKGPKVVSKKIVKLKAKKKYYVRVRTYKKVGSATFYSAWSKAKYVTTKK